MRGLQLVSCSTPAFVTVPAYYFGNKIDFDAFYEARKKYANNEEDNFITAYEEYRNGNTDVKFHSCYQEIPLFKDARVCGHTVYSDSEREFEISNIYDYSYKFGYSSCRFDVIWVYYENMYYRAYKGRLNDFMFIGDTKRVVSSCLPVWGQCGIIKFCGKGKKDAKNTLYIVDAFFKNYDECKKDMNEFKSIDLKSFCLEIIGDG